MIEIGGWSPAMVVLDAMEKNAGVRVLQTELNDSPGVCMKLYGRLGDVEHAARVAEETAKAMQTSIIVHVIPGPSDLSRAAYEAAVEVNPLIEQATVQKPDNALGDQASFAVGLIETQGFTAVFEAIDTALKTAAVEVLAREKLGGGYITVLIKGDVAAVRAAVDAGKAKVEGLGRLVAAHVIPSPSKGVLSLLPK
ncbi:MAG: BMC domain-containing protein [Bryobacterales bacterium]|nr:BMC domain-containing protein [Bryobacterales bacterium]